MTTDVSIVIPSLGRAALLARCLDTVTDTVACAHEIICVTVADDTDSADVIAARPRITHIVEARRNGFVCAANRGFRVARGRYLLQINDDCRLMPHSVDNAVRFMDVRAHRGVGQAAFFHDTPMSRNVFQQIDIEGTAYRVAHVRGLCYANFGMIRRDVSERLGHYDERFAMYGADPDLSLRVWHDAGMSVLPCPGSLIRHEAIEDERSLVERPGQWADNERLFQKWNMNTPSGAGATA